MLPLSGHFVLTIAMGTTETTLGEKIGDSHLPIT